MIKYDLQEIGGINMSTYNAANIIKDTIFADLTKQKTDDIVKGIIDNKTPDKYKSIVYGELPVDINIVSQSTRDNDNKEREPYEKFAWHVNKIQYTIIINIIKVNNPKGDKILRQAAEFGYSFFLEKGAAPLPIEFEKNFENYKFNEIDYINIVFEVSLLVFWYNQANIGDIANGKYLKQKNIYSTLLQLNTKHITVEDLIKYLSSNNIDKNITFSDIVVHETNHAYDSYIKAKTDGKLSVVNMAMYQASTKLSDYFLSIGLINLSKLFYMFYYFDVAENLVRPAEIKSSVVDKIKYRDEFIPMMQKNELYKKFLFDSKLIDYDYILADIAKINKDDFFINVVSKLLVNQQNTHQTDNIKDILDKACINIQPLRKKATPEEIDIRKERENEKINARKYIANIYLNSLYDIVITEIKYAAVNLIMNEAKDKPYINSLLSGTPHPNVDKLKVQAFNKLKQKFENYRKTDNPVKNLLENLLKETRIKYKRVVSKVFALMQTLPERENKRKEDTNYYKWSMQLKKYDKEFQQKQKPQAKPQKKR